MKLVLLLLLISGFAASGYAQTNKEPELTKEQKWQIAWTEAFYKQKGENASTRIFLNQFKKIVASDRLCKRPSISTATLDVAGDRISSNIAVLTLDITNAKKDDSYIIERRYNNHVGQYDSVGVVTVNAANSSFTSFNFNDNNNYPGKTWYRIRTAGSNKEKKLVCIEGYTNTVSVFPNPATSSSLSIQLRQFKTDDNTTLVVSDARGIPVYTQSKVFLNDANLLRLQTLKLRPGTYFVKVTNKFNTGSTSFLVQ